MEKRFTTHFNTPCASSWNAEWCNTVSEHEERLGHPICGARTLDGTPCTLPPNHQNGRCKFHGGFDTTGAQPGNRNAMLHGLYARGLQRCGTHCPQWSHCPCASDDVKQLPRQNRPQCPYETTQYQMVLTDLENRRFKIPGADELDRHTTHQAALLHVMILRATAALTLSGLTDTNTASSDNYASITTKPAAALTAFLHLSAEYRRFLATLDSSSYTNLTFEEKCTDTRRRIYDTELTPEAQEQLNTTSIPGKDFAESYITQAAECVQRARQTEQALHELSENDTVEHVRSSQFDDLDEEEEEEDREYERKHREQEKQSYENERNAATVHYKKAFALYPPLAEILKDNPKHDPSLFPNLQKDSFDKLKCVS